MQYLESDLAAEPSRVHRVLNHVSIRVKLGALAAISALVMLLLAGWQGWQTYDTAYEARKTAIRQQVDTASSVLRWAQGMEAAGTLSRTQAQQLAIQAVRGLRYGGQEYFWINDMQPRVVLHPVKPALEGQDVSGLKDPEGNALFVRFVDTVQRQQAGYVAYLWPKPGREQPVEKVSYVAGFAPWGWVIGSGLYMDDLRAEMWQHLRGTAVWLAGAVAVLLLVLHLVYASITRGLDKAARVAKAIAAGDVSHDILLVGSDEIGDLIHEMKRMSDRLNETMGEVHDAATQLAHSSTEIAEANQDLSGRTERAAAHLQQAAANLAQLTGSVQGNAQAAQRAQGTAGQARTVAGEGGAIVGQAVGAMDDIQQAAQRIAAIIGTIDGIAFQTNILALNAAVEAARAGEQGRGFAVVASEVRALASRSAAAAREIKALSESAVSRTSAGAGMVQQAGGTMDRVVASVQEVHALIDDITRASVRQGEGIVRLNDAVGELDQMTQQNAALVDQSAAAAQSLKDQAGRLTRAVQRFKLSAAPCAR